MKGYVLRKDVKEETVLTEVGTVLSKYGLRLGSGSGSTVPIERNGEKIGHVWYNTPSYLTLNITSPEGLGVEGIETELYEVLKNKGLYEPPKQIPKTPLLPIEVVRNGKRTTLEETGSPIDKMVEVLYRNHVQSP